MRIPIHQVDAFTTKMFAGNPAAVCPLDAWIEPALMQSIASENNLSETAFLVKRKDGDYDIRWFTPAAEIDLAGHPTLASAFIVFEVLEKRRQEVVFHTRKSGALTVKREGELIVMDFPTLPPKRVDPPPLLSEALGGVKTRDVLLARDLMCVVGGERDVRAVVPRLDLMAKLSPHGVIVTSPGEEADFVSRFFAPNMGVPEDPVTGSAHCTLVPYWAERLGRTRLSAQQVSARGGQLHCEHRGDRVTIAGRAVRFLEGTILLP